MLFDWARLQYRLGLDLFLGTHCSFEQREIVTHQRVNCDDTADYAHLNQDFGETRKVRVPGDRSQRKPRRIESVQEDACQHQNRADERERPAFQYAFSSAAAWYAAVRSRTHTSNSRFNA